MTGVQTCALPILASQYSSGLGGALAQNLPEIKTATSAAQLANALDKGNVLGALSAGANLTDTQIPSELKTGIAGLGLAQALASGNVPQAMALGSQFLPPESSGADVGPPPPPAGGISSLLPSAETPADQQVATADTNLPAGAPAGLEQLVQTQPLVQQAEVAQTQPSNIEQVLPIVPAGIEQLAQNQEPIALPSQQLTQETAAGLEQLANAINNPDITSSYTGAQVADLSGTTGLPTDQPGEQDLEQLGVGLPTGIETLPLQAEQTATQDSADTTGGIDTLAQQQADLDKRAEQEHQAQIAREEEDRIRAEETPVDDREKEKQDRILKEQEDQIRQEQAYWRLVQQRRLEQGAETPDVPVNTEVANDGTTDGINDLIKTLPVTSDSEQDLAQLGVGLPALTGENVQDITNNNQTTTEQGTAVNNSMYSDYGEDNPVFGTESTVSTPADTDDLYSDYGDSTGEGSAGTSYEVSPGEDGATVTDVTGTSPVSGGLINELAKNLGVSPGLLKMIAGGLGLGGLGSLLGQQQQQAPAPTPYTGPLSNIKMGSNYTPYTYKPYAGGGAVGEMLNNDQYTMAVGYPDYASNFSPTGTAMAAGGIASLGGYSDGGRLLRGPGDGVSDSIPAMIGNKQPARLADGEFVIPARIVSELGNGSTEAGARQLYAMMDRIQAARRKTVGKEQVARNTKAAKNLPA